MPVVVVVRQGVEGTAGLENRAVGVNVRQDHAGAAFQGHPAAHLQGAGLQQDVGVEIVAAEEPVLDDPGGVGDIQGDKALTLQVLQADGGAGGDLAVDSAVFSRQNADGLFFDELIGDVHFAGLRGGQSQVYLALLQQSLQVGGGGFCQLQGHVGILPGEDGHNIRQDLHGPGDADPQAQAASVLVADAFDLRLQPGIDLQHGLHGLQVALSGIGQVEGGGTPVEERRAYLLLDLPQGLAQGGLADIKLLCRGGDGAVPGNGLKIEGLLHIHIIFTTFLQHIHEIYHFGPIFIIKDFLWMSR